jgi:hypothetical protein
MAQIMLLERLEFAMTSQKAVGRKLNSRDTKVTQMSMGTAGQSKKKRGERKNINKEKLTQA